MSEMDLLKTILRRIVQLEDKLLKHYSLQDISEQLDDQADAIRHLHVTLSEFKGAVDSHHLENINSDDMLLRSILHQGIDR